MRAESGETAWAHAGLGAFQGSKGQQVALIRTDCAPLEALVSCGKVALTLDGLEDGRCVIKLRDVHRLQCAFLLRHHNHRCVRQALGVVAAGRAHAKRDEVGGGGDSGGSCACLRLVI